MQDVLYFLKNGRKAPPDFANLDKINRRKNLHTLSQFSRNFVYEGMIIQFICVIFSLINQCVEAYFDFFIVNITVIHLV